MRAVRRDWLALIYSLAPRYRVDPMAAAAVAATEGLSGGVGDAGTSFGPFQLHVGGALPRGKGRAWAESPAGIEYAMRMIGSVAGGMTGRRAIENIVRRFERPADPEGQIARALALYGSPSLRPSGSAAAPSPGAPAAVNATTTPPTSTPPVQLVLPLPSGLLARRRALNRMYTGKPLLYREYVKMLSAGTLPVPPSPSPWLSTPPEQGGVDSSPGSRRTAMVATHGSQRPRRIILHTTESEGKPESVIRFWRNQGRGFGAHFIIDSSGRVVEAAPPTAVTWHTGGANKGSVGIEIMGHARYTRPQWLKRRAQLDAIARTIARIASAYGIPLPSGVTTHAAVSRTHPESEGHWDPGPGFPLDYVLALARTYMMGG